MLYCLIASSLVLITLSPLENNLKRGNFFAVNSARNSEEERSRLIDEYKETFANPYRAAALGYIDDVINPNETRKKLCLALNMLMDKQENRPERKHGNIPL